LGSNTYWHSVTVRATGHFRMILKIILKKKELSHKLQA
jgi:hypothetical protein